MTDLLYALLVVFALLAVIGKGLAIWLREQEDMKNEGYKK